MTPALFMHALMQMAMTVFTQAAQSTKRHQVWCISLCRITGMLVLHQEFWPAAVHDWHK